MAVVVPLECICDCTPGTGGEKQTVRFFCANQTHVGSIGIGFHRRAVEQS